MKKSATLPVIKEKETISAAASKSKETFKKLENKVNNQDDEIVKNEKMISNLAIQFKRLKEQLQFQQEYTQKYRSTVNKYQQESNKYIRIVKDQKANIIKLENTINQKQKLIDQAHNDNKKNILRIQVLNKEIQQLNSTIKKKDEAFRAEQNQKQKLKRQLKDKMKQIKQRKSLQNQQSTNLIKSQEGQISRMEKQIAFMNSCMENNKNQSAKSQKIIEELKVDCFRLQEQLKKEKQVKHKVKSLQQQNRLLTLTCEQLQKKIKNFDNQKQKLQKEVEKAQNKQANILAQQLRQFNQQKSDLRTKLQQSKQEIQDLKNKNKAGATDQQKLKEGKEEMQKKINQLDAFKNKINKSKQQISQQLLKIRDSIVCQFCQKQVKNPVTNIPCGHTYCLQCKKGYEKQCVKCPGVKRQAVYRNQLLDEIVEATKAVDIIMGILQS